MRPLFNISASSLHQESRRLMDEQYLEHLKVSLLYAICIGLVFLFFENNTAHMQEKILWGVLFLAIHGFSFFTIKYAHASLTQQSVYIVDGSLLVCYATWIALLVLFGWHETSPFEVFWRGSLVFVMHIFHIEALRYSQRMLLLTTCFVAGGEILYMLLIAEISTAYILRISAALLLAVVASYGIGYSGYLLNLSISRTMIKNRNRVLELDGLVYKDTLTELFNRRYFDEHLAHHLEDFQHEQQVFCVAIIDIDFFKTINDSYGHLAGDAVLKQLAATISKEIRSSDIVARYGGEEFVILMPNTRKEVAQRVLDKLRNFISNSLFTFESTAIHLTVSIGITEVQSSDSSQRLLERSDKGLYTAKTSGRNIVCVC